MADRYEALAASIDAGVSRFGGDEGGYHHTVVGVLQLLHELECGAFDLHELPKNLYDFIAGVHAN